MVVVVLDGLVIEDRFESSSMEVFLVHVISRKCGESGRVDDIGGSAQVNIIIMRC